MTHQELIAALEKATGPDRELGNEVLFACGWRMEEDGPRPDPSLYWIAPNGEEFIDGDQPDPTASIDAAMTLVPEGWYCVGVLRDNEGEWVPRLRQNKRGLLSAHANHPQLSIALCIAALRARALNPKDET